MTLPSSKMLIPLLFGALLLMLLIANEVKEKYEWHLAYRLFVCMNSICQNIKICRFVKNSQKKKRG
jgi:hypothetical protein